MGDSKTRHAERACYGAAHVSKRLGLYASLCARLYSGQLAVMDFS